MPRSVTFLVLVYHALEFIWNVLVIREPLEILKNETKSIIGVGVVTLFRFTCLF